MNSSPRHPFAFRPEQRLRNPADYKLVYDQKNRAGDHVLLLFVACNALGWTRLGKSVSRKHGNSVVRHRFKRLIREAFRLSQSKLPVGLDVVVIPRAGAMPSLEAVVQSLVSLAVRLAARAH